ncbi:MAG: DNA-binding protein [Desulfopila sp.]
MIKKYTCSFAIAALLTLSGHLSALADNGSVVETMNASGYTYMLVDNGGQKTWVAIPETTVAVGDQVNYSPGMEMKDFHSKTLNRTFATIVFSAGLDNEQAATDGGAAAATSKTAGEETPHANASFAAAVAREQQVDQTAAPADPAAMPEMSGGSSGAVVPFATVSVTKAPGDNSYTVAEIFQEAKKLQGATVRLRGQVVKFSPAIMGRNWVHLQDGTGDPMNNTHDLVVTTDATVAKGDTVIVEGVVAADRDFGAGYTYMAIVEEAKIVN